MDRRVVDPDRPLLGTRWVLDGIISGETVSSVPAGVSAALTFSDGRVEVEGGCNQGGGVATLSDSTISFGPIGMTKMECEADAMAVDQAMLDVLSEPASWSIFADTLTLSTGASGLVLSQPAELRGSRLSCEGAG